MSIVGVFSKARPSIGGLFFDAILEESTELASEVTEYPIENGALGSDHVVLKPLLITMSVGVSDNPFRALSANTDIPVAGNIAGTAAGAAIGLLPADVATAVGFGADAANAAFSAGQASTRSQSVLEQMRSLQRSGVLLDVVGANEKSYTGCLIRNTRQATTKENEKGLELIVELVQPLIINTQRVSRSPEKNQLPGNDPVGTQAQPIVERGEVSLIE